MWDEPRSPNVAIKWDKVPLQISAKSSITSKVKRDDSHYTWNEYKIEVTERFQGSTRRTNTVKNIGFNKDFMLKPGSSWFDLKHGGKANYTVFKDGKPGAELIAKITISSRIDNPNLPKIPKRPPRPSPPPRDAGPAAWSRYRRRLETWKKKMADIDKLERVHNLYFSVIEDQNPIKEPATGYNFEEYRQYHVQYNKFIDNHYKRYVSIEGEGKRLIWFTRKASTSVAESKNVIVHKPVDPGKGGLDPGIIVNPPKPPK